MRIAFFVPGTARPAGSKIGTVVRRGDGTVVTKAGRPVVAMRDASGAHGAQWRADVKYAARRVYSRPPVLVPVELDVICFIARSKGHYGTGRNRETLKPSALLAPTSKPDATKLIRSIEDALTGIVWRDDAQVVRQHVSKVYARDNPPGALIEISDMTPEVIAIVDDFTSRAWQRLHEESAEMPVDQELAER